MGELLKISRSSKRFLYLLGTLGITAVVGCGADGDSASFDDPDMARASTLAATCAACHGTEGRSVDSSIPSLAGLSVEVLVDQLQEIRSDQYEGDVMHQLVRGYSDEDLRLIATYFAPFDNAQEDR